MGKDTEHDYWQALAGQIGGHCDFYSAEDLAAFVDGRVRGRNARALEAHLRDCEDCRELVAELRRELAPEPVTARVRFAPARGWTWALAGSAVAAVLIAIVLLRPGTPGVQNLPGVTPQPPASIAKLPPAANVKPAPTPRVAPETRAVKATPAKRHAGPRVHPPRPAATREEPEQLIAAGGGITNLLPATATLAFGEPLTTTPAVAAEVEELLRQGAVNDLPEAATSWLDEALVDELYRGFDGLEESIRRESGGAGQ